MANSISINVPILARIEGEGSLELEIQDSKIKSLKLKIYEPPRLFEKFLEGRHYSEVLDIVARICGICPVAYQMSATQAIENCFDFQPNYWLREIRRLFYCGEWIESHCMHIHFLALPDFLGFTSIIEMSKKYPKEVKRGLALQSFGNELICLLGARSVHPVGACVGGFYKAPEKSQVNALLQKATKHKKSCEELIYWLNTLALPDTTQDFICVSLTHPDEYPMNEGRIISDQGLNISIDEFPNYFKEHQVAHSNALACTFLNKPYLVGPLARMNNCFNYLPQSIKVFLQDLNIKFPSKNMYHSIIARAVELYYSITESIRILEQYQLPQFSYQDISPREGIGFGCTEAPRGLLWHQFNFNRNGMVESARIVTPTNQNQARIEEDLYISIQKLGVNSNPKKLRAHSEMIIRNYDPCISCSTHFLNLTVNKL